MCAINRHINCDNQINSNWCNRSTFNRLNFCSWRAIVMQAPNRTTWSLRVYWRRVIVHSHTNRFIDRRDTRVSFTQAGTCTMYSFGLFGLYNRYGSDARVWLELQVDEWVDGWMNDDDTSADWLVWWDAMKPPRIQMRYCTLRPSAPANGTGNLK